MIAKDFVPYTGIRSFAIMERPPETRPGRQFRAGMGNSRAPEAEQAMVCSAGWPTAVRQVITRQVLRLLRDISGTAEKHMGPWRDDRSMARSPCALAAPDHCLRERYLSRCRVQLRSACLWSVRA